MYIDGPEQPVPDAPRAPHGRHSGSRTASSLVFIYNDSFEQLDRPFEIQSGVTIPAGGYPFGEPSAHFNSNPSGGVYERLSYSPQTFSAARARTTAARSAARPQAMAVGSSPFSRNDAELPWGAFIVDLAVAALGLRDLSRA